MISLSTIHNPSCTIQRLLSHDRTPLRCILTFSPALYSIPSHPSITDPPPAEDSLNIALREITVTARDGRVSQLEQVYIRGSMARPPFPPSPHLILLSHTDIILIEV